MKKYIIIPKIGEPYAQDRFTVASDYKTGMVVIDTVNGFYYKGDKWELL